MQSLEGQICFNTFLKTSETQHRQCRRHCLRHCFRHFRRRCRRRVVVLKTDAPDANKQNTNLKNTLKQSSSGFLQILRIHGSTTKKNSHSCILDPQNNDSRIIVLWIHTTRILALWIHTTRVPLLMIQAMWN